MTSSPAPLGSGPGPLATVMKAPASPPIMPNSVVAGSGALGGARRARDDGYANGENVRGVRQNIQLSGSPGTRDATGPCRSAVGTQALRASRLVLGVQRAATERCP